MTPPVIPIGGEIRLAKTGEWSHDGTLFTNEKLIALFNRSVWWDDESKTFVLRVGDYRATFVCEDTAYFVDRLLSEVFPPALSLSDGSQEPLRVDSLSIGSEDQIYFTRATGHLARFRRSAHQELLSLARDEEHITIGTMNIRLVKRILSR